MKVYRSTHYDEITIPLYVKGKRVYCEFTGSSKYPSHVRGSFSTPNPDIQSKLEKHVLFGKQFVLEGEIEEKPLAQDDAGEPIEVQDIKSLTQARKWLNRQKQVPMSKMQNREKLLAVAHEMNITFPDLILD